MNEWSDNQYMKEYRATYGWPGSPSSYAPRAEKNAFLKNHGLPANTPNTPQHLRDKALAAHWGTKKGRRGRRNRKSKRKTRRHRR